MFRMPIVAAAAALAAGSPALADIDLEFRAAAPSVTVGDPIEVELFAVSDGASDQLFSAAQVVFTWDPAVLELVSTSSSGAIPLLSNGLPANGDFDLNEADPPADGDGFLLCLAQFGNPAVATPAGSLLHTFTFEAVAAAPATEVAIAVSGGSGAVTKVIDGTVPGLDVTGALIPAVIEVTEAACPGDLDDGGDVGFGDLLILLSAWGACDGCAADLDGSGDVAFADLLVLLSAWGPCPA